MMEYYCISSCRSSNKKQLDRRLRRCPTTTTDDDNDDDDGDALAAAASAMPSHASEKSEKISLSTDMLMRMAASVSAATIASGGAPPCRRRRPARSSFGSCGGMWSIGDCPPTPSSPFCSPLASSAAASSSAGSGDDSFATPYQGSHVSREKEEEEEIEGRKMAANYGSFKKLLHPKKLQGAINPSLMHNKRREARYPLRLFYLKINLAENVNQLGFELGPRVPTTKPFATCFRDGQIVNSCYANTAAACNWDSESEGTYYTGSSGGGGSKYENLGSESSTRWRPGGSRRCRCFSARSIRSKVEAKLLAWKEARISKLMNKLRKKEAAINEWEQQQITKAKQDMKELEMKLEKRRTMAMQEMQWRIMIAHEKATKKKMEEQATAAMKISNVDRTFEDISNNKKLPWRLFFLCSSINTELKMEEPFFKQKWLKWIKELLQNNS
uniref:Remorin C-terminal domain-containing protein n=1 Tax=Ananas comosus var. bracteatus TaxID=296719 RepID=A0A6V7NJK3_ANACO|nr:unnamed protein product [Ananas comosus var. bracteatus]